MKIAEETSPPPKKEKVKKWIKATLGTAVGTGIGTGIYMLGERAFNQKLGPGWRSLQPATQRSIVGAVSGIGTLGGMLLANRLQEEKRKYQEEHE